MLAGGIAVRWSFLALGLTVWLLSLVACEGKEGVREIAGTTIELPVPRTSGPVPLERALAERRSVRAFTDEPLSLEELSQLLWSAQGITAGWGGRTAPSAGALYPLEVYAVTPQGLYRYVPEGHRALLLATGDLRSALAGAALEQEAVRDAPTVLVIAAVFERTEVKYGARAERYVHLEAGHAAQNVLLQAVGLGLGAVPIGAFSDRDVQRILGLPRDHAPLYLIPVGHPAPE